MRRILVLAAVGAASAYVIAVGLPERLPRVAFDVYFYFYPHILYALERLAAGGNGLLWNPFQNCGQPFLANAETVLFYPLNLLYLVLDAQTALRAVLFTNLVIGGVGMYGLSRALAVGTVGSLGAALVFVLGTASFNLTNWMPTVQTAYVWMPVAMYCCERLIQQPTLPRVVWLGLALALPLLGGHPQFVLFLCQLIGLRLLWSLLDGAERPRSFRSLGGVGVAVVLMILLATIQLLPALEVAAESARSAGLRQEEATRAVLTPDDMSRTMRNHFAMAPFTVFPGMLAAAAIVGAARRRVVLFYAAAGMLFLVLAFGDATPLWRLYFGIPVLGNLFRMPLRFQFVSAFCIAVLSGFAIDAIRRGSVWAAASMAMALLGFSLWLRQLQLTEWWIVGAVVASAVGATVSKTARPIAGPIIVAMLAVEAVLIPVVGTRGYLRDDGPLYAHHDLFAWLRPRLSPQDRIDIARPPGDVSFQDKTAMLFGVPAISDYELQQTRRYAEYWTMLRTGRPLTSLNQVYYLGPWNPRAMQWRLVDLAATRYLMVHESLSAGLEGIQSPAFTRIGGDSSVRVYENARALPRAYYVPSLAVEPDDATRLRRLAQGNEDRRRVALVAEMPASGFLGVPGNDRSADAQFIVNDPEHLRIDLVAPERGFLFLADQYFPGWSATVNGQPAPILLGNYVFRLVEVPKGPTRVEFRYHSRRFWLGLVISTLSLCVATAILVRRRGVAPSLANRP